MNTLKLFTITAIVSAVGMAAPSSPATPDSGAAPSAGTVIATPSAPGEGKVTALIDIRPEIQLQKGKDNFGQIENSIDLGYQFDPNNYLGLHHEMNSNMGDAGVDKWTAGDFIVRAKINNIWEDRSAGLSLSYEPRVYLPTRESLRNAGMITTVRNYFKLKQDLGAGHALTLMEIPIAHVFDNAGVAGKANPAFENRVYLVYEASLTKDLSLAVPLMWNATKGRSLAGAPGNSDWGHVLWAWPELDYAIDSTFTVGLAYQTDNLIKADFSDTAFDTGFGNGIVQAVLQVNL